jgi:protoheme IX farnesyltransferase
MEASELNNAFPPAASDHLVTLSPGHPLIASPPHPFTPSPPHPLTLVSSYVQLVRPRIVSMVLFTMAVAAMVSGPQVPAWADLVHGLVGVGLVIVGAIALNQRLEHHSDALMTRTARRPLPSGRLSDGQATGFGLAASLLGAVYLALLANGTVVTMAAASWLIYVWMYTPLKMFSAWQTPVGAVAGAMPALLGAAVAGAAAGTVAWALFGVVYFWQFPHAMAIAWLYRHQCAAAGLRVASVTDPTGRTAGLLALAGALALVPVSMLPWWTGRTGWGYAVAAAVLGLAYLGQSAVFLRSTDDRTARRLLRVSLLYLPLLLGALLLAS